MRILIGILLLCFSGVVSAQTVEEQIEAKVAEIAVLCDLASPGVNCYILTQAAVCPDPLLDTRAQLQAASTNLTAAAQAVDAVLLDNPVP